MINSGQIPILSDVAEFFGRSASRFHTGGNHSHYEGFGSPKFFQDLNSGPKYPLSISGANSSYAHALEEMESRGYGNVWKHSVLRGKIRKEIEKDVKLGRYKTTSFRKLVPRGIVTRRWMYGLNKFENIFEAKAMKIGLGFGGFLTLMQTATAPRGKMASQAVAGSVAAVGGMAGAAVGGALLGVPGDVIGGWLGGNLGELAGRGVEEAKNFYNRQAHYLDFGRGYQDSEAAYTMRQRGIYELNRSLLNARQYLGKEAALMHS